MSECYKIEVEPSFPGWTIQVERWVNGERSTVLGEPLWYTAWTVWGGRRRALRKARAIVAEDQQWRERRIEKHPERKLHICRSNGGEWEES